MGYTVEGATGSWEIVVGLEVHAQVNTQSKLFSGAATTYGAEPNTQVSLVDAAMPGMLPVVNNLCIEQAVKTGLGLKSEINLLSVFERKNYFYPDLPQGYQISQFAHPIVGKGVVLLDMPDGSTREIGITRLHLEQDAGKSVHDMLPGASCIDLNRSGVPLMEIVSEPDIRDPEEAVLYMRKLRSILRYLDTCDGNMEEGSLRCDANISVRRPGEDFGTRCEIKNVNSMRFVAKAIEYEARRQVELIEAGGEVVQETRLYDSRSGETRSMRSKEEAHDYRYFPDPDLLPLQLTEGLVTQIRSTLPELPDDRKKRYIDEYGLSAYDAGVLVAEQDYGAYFEKAAEGRDRKLVANWIISELFGRLNKGNIAFEDCPVAPEQLSELTGLIEDGTISGRIAKDVFDIMFTDGGSPLAIVEEKGLKQISDDGPILEMIASVMEANPDKVADFRGGKEKLFGFFVGQVMRAAKGKANPQTVNALLKKALSDQSD